MGGVYFQERHFNIALIIVGVVQRVVLTKENIVAVHEDYPL